MSTHSTTVRDGEQAKVFLRFPAFAALFVGILMIGQWLFFLGTGQVPELQAAPVVIAFHLVAELLTALVLLAAGAGLLLRWRWALPTALVGFGMLLYTVINSAGFFAQQEVWALVLMFALLLVLTMISIGRLLWVLLWF